MNTKHSNFGQGYRLTSAAFKLRRFTVSELQKLTGAGVNTVYSFIHRLENVGEGLLESMPVASLSPRAGAPRKQYWLTQTGADYLAKMSFEKAAQFGASETESALRAEESANVSAQASQWVPAVRIDEQDGAAVITAELPGMAEDDVKVEVTSNVLTICGESQLGEAAMHNKVQLTEWHSSFVLPPGIDPEQIHAKYNSGVLTITVRKPAQVNLKTHRQSEPQRRAAPKLTGYGLQLREKQKTKRIYFNLESQFRNYFEKAARKPRVTGELLLQQLERRLDNVVYRLGFATSRRQARQIVRHGHIDVNGRRVNTPSFQVSAGDEIQVRDKAKKFMLGESTHDFMSHNRVAAWLEVDRSNLRGRVLSLPKREDIRDTVSQRNVSEREAVLSDFD